MVEGFIERYFDPFLHYCTKYRKVTISIGIAILIITVSYVASGRIGMILMPRVESDRAGVTATLPVGNTMFKAKQVRNRLVDAAQQVIEENGGDELSKGIFAEINENTVQVRIYLRDPDIRPISTSQVTTKWRRAAGNIPGLRSILFQSDLGGPGSGAGLSVELSHRNIDILDKASEKLAERMEDFPNVKDIDDGYTPGKEQLTFQIKPEGKSLGLTAYDIARQLRNSFYGAEAIRQQRGRNEVQVRVKFPEEQRDNQYNVENMLVTTDSGKNIPLKQVARMDRGTSYTTITRRNGRRTVTVTANVEPISQTNQVMTTLNQEILPKLAGKYSGLSYGWEGRQADMFESMESLIGGFVVALLIIYVMLAIPFKSYLQPVIVMVAIPFGIVGAVIGHLIMGYSLSVMSAMGVVALSGVVVNDSLILIEYANSLRIKENLSAFYAIHQAGVRRFRPVMLTTLTTFGGLTPMIMETSFQAKFMIPMAVSLGFGILFATGITLLLVPCLYLLLEDTANLLKKR
jgi:multidrug efflux pump subunit AcrB